MLNITLEILQSSISAAGTVHTPGKRILLSVTVTLRFINCAAVFNFFAPLLKVSATADPYFSGYFYGRFYFGARSGDKH